MKHKTGFYSIILTSVVCMLVGSVHAASSVRVLGANGKAVVGASSNAATGASVDSVSKSGIQTKAVGQNPSRVSSLRFAPTVSTRVDGNTATQSYSGLVSDTAKSDSNGLVLNPSNGASARLSIGKYLNLSHTNRPVGTGTTSTGATGAEVDALRADLDKIQDQIDKLKDGKQNLLVGKGDYIDIAGNDSNEISIDIEALQQDLKTALGTDREILTELDGQYKLWWCYADANGAACDGDKRLVVDLGGVDLANENTSLKQALAGKQGKLTAAESGLIKIEQDLGTLDIDVGKLKTALNIPPAKVVTSIDYNVSDGVLTWSYSDDEEGETHSASLEEALQDKYASIEQLGDYAKKSDLGGYQGVLKPDENGYLTITDNKIALDIDKVQEGLGVAGSRPIEMRLATIGDNEKQLQWRYADDENDTWHKVDDNGALNTIISTWIEDYNVSGVIADDITSGEGAVAAAIDGVIFKPDETEGSYISVAEDKHFSLNYDDLKQALVNDLQGDALTRQDIDMQLVDGVLQWKYNDQDVWQDGPALTSLLNGYVKESEIATLQQTISQLNDTITQMQQDLDDKQIHLTPVDDYITLTAEGDIGINMNELRSQLALSDRVTDMRVASGELQWRYSDDYDEDNNQVWRTLNLNDVDLPYVKENDLASAIETQINETLQILALPEEGPIDNGLYLLSVGDDGSVWTAVEIVDAEGPGE